MVGFLPSERYRNKSGADDHDRRRRSETRGTKEAEPPRLVT